MKPSWAYIRVSTDEQTELSPDAQLREIKVEAKKLGYDIIRVWEELGESAKTDKRPVFREMIATAKVEYKNIDAIFVHKFSRFARNREDSIVYKNLLRKKLNIEVIAAKENFGNDLYGRLLEGFIEIMDEFYSLNLSAEVIKGQTEKALRGGNLTRPAYGYYVPTPGAEFEVNAEQANIVKIIFDLFVNQGLGQRAIAIHLNEILNSRQPNGNTWHKARIKYILANPLYIGYRRWNVHNSTNGYSIKDKSEWIIEKAENPAIIDEFTFRRAQEIIESRKGRGSGIATEYLLSGLLRCPSCGGGMSVLKARYSIRCVNYAHGNRECNNSYVRLKTVEEEVINNIEDIITGKLTEFNIDIKTTNNTSEEELLAKQLSETEKRLIRIKDAYEAGIDSLEEYKEKKTNILNQQQDIKERIKQIKKTGIKTGNFKKNLKELYKILKSDAPMPIKKQYIQKNISKIYVSKEAIDIIYQEIE